MEDLIVLKQLPVIEEKLQTLKARWEQMALDAEAMVCTEETIQAVKSFRAEMRKEFDGLEEQRKQIKNAVMGPYEQFLSVYMDCVATAFKTADAIFARKISEVENDMKRRCEDGLRDYFMELCAVRRLDWLSYERAGVKVDMASARAKTPAKLRKQLAEFVDGVGDNVDRIIELEDADEIMVEFRKSLDAAKAICDVRQRRQQASKEREEREARKALLKQEAETVRRVEALAPQVEAQPPQKNPDDIFERFTYTVFDVKRSQLWKIRDFLNTEGIRYE